MPHNAPKVIGISKQSDIEGLKKHINKIKEQTHTKIQWFPFVGFPN